ncbi:hypothetical protein [Streptomyces chumphonensis]|uniref:hypothetical protein n=1 Tax=Streptomyces chumphonensis TaxID=1214925 RepID=UPI003D7342AF
MRWLGDVRYDCVLVARASDLTRGWELGSHRAATPGLALRWLRWKARLVATALDPRPGDSGPLPAACLREVHSATANPGAVMRRWVGDVAAQDAALARLHGGRPATVCAGDDAVHYLLAAHPVLVPPGRACGWPQPRGRAPVRR